MDFTASPIQVLPVAASAMLATVVGLFALLRRGHWLTTLFFSASFLTMAAFQAGTLGILQAPSMAAARSWASYLAGCSALASWLWLSLSVVLARPDPWRQIRNAGAYLTLALVGCIAMFLAAGSPLIVRRVESVSGETVILFGTMGKVYLMYLVVVMVAVLMNLERMLRTAPASRQRRLRPMFLSFLVGILALMLVVSGGLLYGGLRTSWMVASAVPTFGAGVVVALALARRRLSDMNVPLARPVIYYSSVSLTLAGAFLLTMAVLSKLLPALTPEWKRAASLGFYLLAGGGGLLLTLSPRANRAVKRFVDRNFYANRYDYRREWERVSGAIRPTAHPDEVCRQIEALVCSVFEAERAAVYLRDERHGPFRRRVGPASMSPVIVPDNPLVAELERLRAPVVFRELSQDLDRIPIAVANREDIAALGAAACAPLHAGDHLLGVLWLSEKRSDEDYTAEDVEFLGAMSRQLAAALGFARLAEELAETRQLESLHRLSSYVLHDIKNHVSGLSLVVENAQRHLANPEFQRDALGVVERTVHSLRALMSQVSSVGRAPHVEPEPCALDQLVEEATAASGLAKGRPPGVRFEATVVNGDRLLLDRRLMLRLIVNLLTNAREALEGGGEIELRAEIVPHDRGRPGDRWLELSVRDTGRGMSEDFIRSSLFRPFTTTKANGLGLGLSQCRGIVEAHGGSISVESRPGEGTTFLVRLPARVEAGERESVIR